MAKNNLVKVMQKQRLEAFNAAMQTCMNIMTVVLNEEFGFGKNRLLRLQDAFNEKFDEYGCLVADDISYGSRKLNDRISQIMKG